MKPVTQTLFGDVVGNCFAACLASLLEIPLEEVAISPGDDWLQSTQAWLLPRNLFYLEVRLDVAVKYPLYEMDDVWVVFVGKSPRGSWMNHAVVGKLGSRNNEVVFGLCHDPHPDRDFFNGNPFAIGFLVQLNPALK